jgi:hypothetical protein
VSTAAPNLNINPAIQLIKDLTPDLFVNLTPATNLYLTPKLIKDPANFPTPYLLLNRHKYS